jgi:CubicO group peptidase (beta-lactamase class C family)
VSAGLLGPAGVVETRGPVDREYRLASVTKLLTACAVLVAAEEGILDLDEPAGPAGSTVRHLLAHASGLPFEAGGLAARPGARRVYSNVAYDLLGELVAERSELPFADYMRAAVLEPGGMAATELRGSPAADAHGTLADLLAFAQELTAPRIVARETLAEATSVQFAGLAGVIPGIGRQDPCDWGLGFELRGHKSPHWTGTRNSPRTFGHFGGAGTFLWVDPDVRLALVVLTDLEFGDWALDAWPKLSDLVLEALSS